MRKGGGFGMLMLVIVVAIVLLLVARQWKSVAPTAAQIQNPGAGAIVDDRGQTEAGEQVRDGQLPDLSEMRQSTSEHADQLQDALEQID